MKIYFTSDQHFGHFNVLKYEPCRMEALAQFIAKTMENFLRYNNDEESNSSALKYILELVNSEDTEDHQEVVKLHDNMLIKKWNRVVKNDDIVWVLGDFSFYNKEKTKAILDQLHGTKKIVLGNHDRHSVSWYYDIGFAYVSSYPIIWSDILLSHEPQGTVNLTNLYGHIHSKSVSTYTSKSMCLCVEKQDFEPKTLQQLINERNEYLSKTGGK